MKILKFLFYLLHGLHALHGKSLFFFLLSALCVLCGLIFFTTENTESTEINLIINSGFKPLITKIKIRVYLCLSVVSIFNSHFLLLVICRTNPANPRIAIVAGWGIIPAPSSPLPANVHETKIIKAVIKIAALFVTYLIFSFSLILNS
jgi:hypothetical protein